MFFFPQISEGWGIVKNAKWMRPDLGAEKIKLLPIKILIH